MNTRPKVIFPGRISLAIGAMGLSRELTNRTVAAVHHSLEILPVESTKNRSAADERCFVCRFSLSVGSVVHSFSLTIDDTTAPSHWIIVEIRHFVVGMN